MCMVSLSLCIWMCRCEVSLSLYQYMQFFSPSNLIQSVLYICIYRDPHSRTQVCCSLLKCATVWCSALQCVEVCCGVLQCVAMCCNVSLRPTYISCAYSHAPHSIADSVHEWVTVLFFRNNRMTRLQFVTTRGLICCSCNFNDPSRVCHN